jgi:hypothetical protein
VNEATEVPPDARGFCPALSPGQFGRDAPEQGGLWHFRAPDGSRFAAHHLSAACAPGMGRFSPDEGWRFHPRPPRFAFRGGGVVPNPWDIVGGRWVRRGDTPAEAA